LDALTVLERKRQEREETLSLLAVDSQSIKKVAFVSEQTGIEGGKWVNGRKRRIAVDTLQGKVPRLEKIAADHGYRTTFVEYVENTCG